MEHKRLEILKELEDDRFIFICSEKDCKSYILSYEGMGFNYNCKRLRKCKLCNQNFCDKHKCSTCLKPIYDEHL